MGADFTQNGCGVLEVNSSYHPLAVALFDSYENYGVFLPPNVKTAYNNIVLFGRVVPFAAFDTDENGEYTSTDLIGRRIVAAIAGINPMDITAGQITLNTTTGKITSIYANQTHYLTIGWHLTGYEDNDL